MLESRISCKRYPGFPTPYHGSISLNDRKTLDVSASMSRTAGACRNLPMASLGSEVFMTLRSRIALYCVNSTPDNRDSTNDHPWKKYQALSLKLQNETDANVIERRPTHNPCSKLLFRRWAGACTVAAITCRTNVQETMMQRQ
jgi:hypothetical protein